MRGNPKTHVQPDLFRKKDSAAFVPMEEVDDPILHLTTEQWQNQSTSVDEKMIANSRLGIFDFAPWELDKLQDFQRDMIAKTERSRQQLYGKTIEQIERATAIDIEELVPDDDERREIVRRDPIRKKRIRKIRKELSEIFENYDHLPSLDEAMSVGESDIDHFFEMLRQDPDRAHRYVPRRILDDYDEEVLAEVLEDMDLWNWRVRWNYGDVGVYDNVYISSDSISVDDPSLDELHIALEELSCDEIDNDNLIDFLYSGRDYEAHSDSPRYYLETWVDEEKLLDKLEEFYGDEEEEEVEETPLFSTNHYVVYEARNVRDLVRESDELKHCVGRERYGHPQAFRDEEIKVFSVRSHAGKRAFTIETSYDGQTLNEVKGKYNRYPGWNTVEAKPPFNLKEWENVLEVLRKLGLEDDEIFSIEDMSRGLDAKEGRRQNPPEFVYAFGKRIRL